jgi:hypothetical protein
VYFDQASPQQQETAAQPSTPSNPISDDKANEPRVVYKGYKKEDCQDAQTGFRPDYEFLSVRSRPGEPLRLECQFKGCKCFRETTSVQLEGEDGQSEEKTLYTTLQFNSHLLVDGQPHPPEDCWLERLHFPAPLSRFIENKLGSDYWISPVSMLKAVHAENLGWHLVTLEQVCPT